MHFFIIFCDLFYTINVSQKTVLLMQVCPRRSEVLDQHLVTYVQFCVDCDTARVSIPEVSVSTNKICIIFLSFCSTAHHGCEMKQENTGDWCNEAKEKYRGIFEIQKSGDKTSPGEIGLDIRTHASPKVGQDLVSGGVSVLCWHAAPVAYVLWKPCTIR